MKEMQLLNEIGKIEPQCALSCIMVDININQTIV